MKLIVDSGSSKADWVFVQKDGTRSLHESIGINPTCQTILPDVFSNNAIKHAIENSEELYFYSAGTSDEFSRNRLKSWLVENGAKGKVEVEEDMLAAARALCGNNAGIVGILGTGSNSCYYDGKNISRKIATLGYILSDEGAGVAIGKYLLRSYFYNQMPAELRSEFSSHFNTDKEFVLEKLYRSGEGNKYLASFARFLYGVDHRWKNEVLEQIFQEYIDLRIKCFPEAANLQLNFIGSIAFYYEDILRRVSERNGYEIGTIIRKPIDKLIEYHLKTDH